MPQKLIRLTSTTGDGVFNTTFNEEIVIPEKSEIALQSLSLERRSLEFSLNQDNNGINFQAVGLEDPDVPTNSGTLTPLGIYKNSNDVSLLTTITRACNGNSSMLTTPDSMNLQWDVSENNGGHVEIRVVPSPLFPITATAELGQTSYFDLASGNDWTEEDDDGKDTLATFHTTKTGSALYRRTNIQGDPTSYWYAVKDSPNKWRVYDRKQTGTPSGAFTAAEVDASNNIIVADTENTTFTPQGGNPPDVVPYEPAPTLSFVVNDRPVVLNKANSEKLIIGQYETDKYGAFRDGDGTGAAGNINECYMYGSVPFIKSTGSFRVRLNRLLTTGEDSAILGLVKGTQGLAKLQNSTLTENDFEYAVKIRGNDGPYQYKLKDEAFTNSASSPINYTEANPNGKNDVIEICLDNGDFLGIINQNSVVGGTGTDSAALMPRQPHDQTQDYYFVLCLMENSTKIALDNIGVSLDPFAVPSEGGMIPPRLIDTYGATTRSDLTTLIQYSGSTELTGAFDFVPPSNRNASLANFLGFPNNRLRQDAFFTAVPDTQVPALQQGPGGRRGGLKIRYNLPNGFFWTGPDVFNLADMPQNILVETQTFTLDSYDSYGLESVQRGANSGGSRRNILATIPVQAVQIGTSANSMLQYEPATLNYIGIKNRGAITTRQLRFRLLSSTYDDLVLENMAAMTLLIRSY